MTAVIILAVAAGLIVYSVLGGVIASIYTHMFPNYRHYANDLPPAGIVGMLWPVAVAFLLASFMFRTTNNLLSAKAEKKKLRVAQVEKEKEELARIEEEIDLELRNSTKRKYREVM